MVEVGAEAGHVGGDDGVEERGDDARGEDLAEDLSGGGVLFGWVGGVRVVGVGQDGRAGGQPGGSIGRSVDGKKRAGAVSCVKGQGRAGQGRAA